MSDCVEWADIRPPFTGAIPRLLEFKSTQFNYENIEFVV